MWRLRTSLETEPALHRASLPDAPGSPILKGEPEQVELLTRACTDDLVEAFGLYRTWTASSRAAADTGTVLQRLATRAAAPLCRVPARRLAGQVAAYDELVGEGGLAAGGSWAVGRLSRSLSVEGAEGIPREGPVLMVSNHPGLADSLSLFAALPREDLRVIAAERAFLQALPNTSRYLIPVEDRPGARPSGLGGLRTAARHLKAGGALLNFPRGGIEPDPASMSGARDSLSGWRESLEVFLRLAPEATVVPAIVSGVVSPTALANPLLRLRRRPEDRRWLAASLQMLAPALRDVHTEVRFGSPVYRGAQEVAEVREEVLGEAGRLIRLAEVSGGKRG